MDLLGGLGSSTATTAAPPASSAPANNAALDLAALYGGGASTASPAATARPAMGVPVMGMTPMLQPQPGMMFYAPQPTAAGIGMAPVMSPSVAGGNSTGAMSSVGADKPVKKPDAFSFVADQMSKARK